MDVLLKIMRLAGGALFFIAGVLIVGQANVAFALPLLVVAGLLLYPFIADPVSSMFSGIVFSRKAADLPEQFSRVRAMVNQGCHAEALEELDRMLAERPSLASARAYQIRILYERMNRGDEALQLATETLSQTRWQTEYEDIAMIAVDVLLEQGRRQDAAGLLTKVLPKITNRQQHSSLEARLRSLQA